jgi:hypothetical protein
MYTEWLYYYYYYYWQREAERAGARTAAGRPFIV